MCRLCQKVCQTVWMYGNRRNLLVITVHHGRCSVILVSSKSLLLARTSVGVKSRNGGTLLLVLANTYPIESRWTGAVNQKCSREFMVTTSGLHVWHLLQDRRAFRFDYYWNNVRDCERTTCGRLWVRMLSRGHSHMGFNAGSYPLFRLWGGRNPRGETQCFMIETEM